MIDWLCVGYRKVDRSNNDKPKRCIAAMEQQSGIASDVQSARDGETSPGYADENLEIVTQYILNGWRLRPAENRLTKGSEEIRLEPKSMDLLLRLAAADGEALRRADLIAKLWPNLYASDDSLNQIVSRLRRCLAKDQRLAKAVITVPKRGYRLDTSVIDVPDEPVLPIEITSSTRHETKQPIYLAVLFFAVAVVASVVAFATIKPNATEEVDYVSMRSSVLTKLVGHSAGVELSPDGEYVAYAWGRTGTQNLDIYVQRIGDHEAQVISQHIATETNPIWSPDGRSLMFTRSSLAGDCSIVRVDLANLAENIIRKCVAGRGVTLAWAPSGGQIFISDRTSATDPFAVHKLDLRTDEITQLTFPEPMTVGDTHMRISPDGAELAFVRNENYVDGNLYVADINGGNVRAATDRQKSIRGLAWHGDGSQIVFATERASAFGLWRTGKDDKTVVPIPTVLGDVRSVSASTKGERIVYEAARINSKVQKLSLSGVELELDIGAKTVSSFDRFPDLSNDGKCQVRISERAERPVLVVTDLENGAEQYIDIGVDLIISASWSPDSKQLLVGGFADKNFDLFLVTPATQEVQRLTEHQASEYNPTWSLDGKRAYFTSNRTGRFEIWCLNIATGGDRQITFNARAPCP